MKEPPNVVTEEARMIIVHVRILRFTGSAMVRTSTNIEARAGRTLFAILSHIQGEEGEYRVCHPDWTGATEDTTITGFQTWAKVSTKPGSMIMISMAGFSLNPANKTIKRRKSPGERYHVKAKRRYQSNASFAFAEEMKKAVPKVPRESIMQRRPNTTSKLRRRDESAGDARKIVNRPKIT